MLASVVETGWQPIGARLTPMRLSVAKKSYVTRHLAAHLDLDRRGFTLMTAAAPHPGDVVLVRVLEAPDGQILEAPDGRGQHLYPGDEVLVAYGSRTRAEVEGEVPQDFGPVDLLAQAGTVGRATGGVPLARFAPLGLLGDDAGVVNMTRFAPFHIASKPAIKKSARPQVLVVTAAGSAPHEGTAYRQRSAAAASLVLGLSRGGSRVAAGKASGSAAVDATGTFHDSGAPVVLDFTDFGYASTYDLSIDELARLAGSLILELCISPSDSIVIEVGDDLSHEQTRRLLAHPIFADLADAIVVVHPDGVRLVPASSPMGLDAQPAVQPDQPGLSMLTVSQLRDPAIARQLAEQVGR